MVLQNWLSTCNRVKFCPYHSHSPESTNTGRRLKCETWSHNTDPWETEHRCGQWRSGQPLKKEGAAGASDSGPAKTLPNNRDSSSSVKIAASVWEARLSTWHSFHVRMYEGLNSKVRPVQSRKWADVWLGFLKEGIQVVNKFIKEYSRSLVVSKMKTEINEMYSHPSYKTFTWKTKDNKCYW